MTASRVVHLSDTHLSASGPLPPTFEALRRGIEADPPDVVVVSGDLVREDPDDDADRAHAHATLTALPCPVAVIPGNHDVGFFDEPDRFVGRRAAFEAAWGTSRFVVDLPGWRLVGVDVYALGEPDHDDWAAAALDVEQRIGVFVHQPLDGDPDDGWQLPAAPRERLGALLAGAATLAFVAAGHRHCAVVDGRPLPGRAEHLDHVVRIWAPSTTFTGPEPYRGGDPSPGAVEYELGADGSFAWRFVRAAPPAAAL